MKVYNVAKTGWDGIEYHSPHYSTEKEARKYLKAALERERQIESKYDDRELEMYGKYKKHGDLAYSNDMHTIRLYKEDVQDQFNEYDLEDD